jgi:hypothetical protein
VQKLRIEETNLLKKLKKAARNIARMADRMESCLKLVTEIHCAPVITTTDAPPLTQHTDADRPAATSTKNTADDHTTTLSHAQVSTQPPQTVATVPIPAILFTDAVHEFSTKSFHAQHPTPTHAPITTPNSTYALTSTPASQASVSTPAMNLSNSPTHFPSTTSVPTHTTVLIVTANTSVSTHTQSIDYLTAFAPLSTFVFGEY